MRFVLFLKIPAFLLIGCANMFSFNCCFCSFNSCNTFLCNFCVQYLFVSVFLLLFFEWFVSYLFLFLLIDFLIKDSRQKVY